VSQKPISLVTNFERLIFEPAEGELIRIEATWKDRSKSELFIDASAVKNFLNLTFNPDHSAVRQNPSTRPLRELKQCP
jgi:hypothetical protein